MREHISFEGLCLPGLTWQQEEIGEALIKEKNVCISAGGGIGKTAGVALLIFWFLSTHPFSRVPTTAPSGKLLNDILWSEIDLWLKRCKLKDLFVLLPGKGKLYVKGFKEWYAVARTVPKDQRDINDTLAGFHGQGGVLIAVDEASGVVDPVFTALDGAMTQPNSYIILISNPVSTGGYYYDTISDPEGKGKDFKVLYYDSRDSPLVTPEYEQRIINRYGKDSPMYKAKVKGLPISESETILITPEAYDKLISENRSTFDGRVILSIDVAGKGANLATIVHRIGDCIVRWDEIPISDTMYLVDEVTRLWRTHYQNKLFCAIVDAHGIGDGVYSVLKRENLFPVIGFIGPEKSFHESMYKNKRAEAYHKLQKTLPNIHFPVPPPERLKKELVNMRFEFDEGLVSLEEKKAFKKRLGFSPDWADGLAMSCIVESFTSQMANPHVSVHTTKTLAALMSRSKNSRYGKFSKFMM